MLYDQFELLYGRRCSLIIVVTQGPKLDRGFIQEYVSKIIRQKEGHLANCALALDASAWSDAYLISSHFISQSTLPDQVSFQSVEKCKPSMSLAGDKNQNSCTQLKDNHKLEGDPGPHK